MLWDNDAEGLMDLPPLNFGPCEKKEVPRVRSCITWDHKCATFRKVCGLWCEIKDRRDRACFNMRSRLSLWD